MFTALCQPTLARGQRRHHPQPDRGILVDTARVDDPDLAKAREYTCAHLQDRRRQRRELIRIIQIPIDRQAAQR